MDNEGRKSAAATTPAGTSAGAARGQDDGASAAGQGAKDKAVVLGDFRLVKKLGEGGMGVVYKGHQISLDRECAVKLLFKHLAANKTFVERFYREARIMAKLDHPNVVRGYGVGEQGGWHYLAMEFVDGGSLQGILKDRGKLSVGDATHVILACAYALQHAHELSLVHRDIKPDNILITRKGVVKVADMGMAKVTVEDLSLTQTGHGAGTPHYMPLEQAKDAKHVDGRCDIYALGCMYYCLLTGEPPFKGETIVELIQAKEKGTFPPARRTNSEVPERLDLIIGKMCAKLPQHRYATCAEVANDLEALGLANPALTFIDDVGGSAVKAMVPPAGKSQPPGSTSKSTAPGGQTASPVSSKSTPPASKAEEADPNSPWWFVSYKDPSGKKVFRKLEVNDLKELLKDEKFDPTAKASRTVNGTYRELATYREFHGLLKGRAAKASADKQTEKFRKLYQEIEKEDLRIRNWRWMRDGLRAFLNTWPGTIVWFAFMVVVLWLLCKVILTVLRATGVDVPRIPVLDV